MRRIKRIERHQTVFKPATLEKKRRYLALLDDEIKTKKSHRTSARMTTMPDITITSPSSTTATDAASPPTAKSPADVPMASGS
jgi:hypothetical protein